MLKELLALVALASLCRATSIFPDISKVYGIGTPLCAPGKIYTIPHPQFCDRYYSCIEGFFHEWQCRDGQAFQPNGECVFSHLVNCSSRPYLQPPQGFGLCPRLYGWFPDPFKGCNYLYECIEGIPTQLVCPDGLMFDAKDRFCRDATPEEFNRCFRKLEPSVTVQVDTELPAPLQVAEPAVMEATGPITPVSQAVELFVEHLAAAETLPSPTVSQLSTDEVPVVDAVPTVVAETTSDNFNLINFTCPKNPFYVFGDHARLPFPGNCRFFVMCWRDGHFTVGGCEEGDAFDPHTYTCRPAKFVASCSSGSTD